MKPFMYAMHISAEELLQRATISMEVRIRQFRLDALRESLDPKPYSADLMRKKATRCFALISEYAFLGLLEGHEEMALRNEVQYLLSRTRERALGIDVGGRP